jgi:hydroxymethylbilane synthase
MDGLVSSLDGRMVIRGRAGGPVNRAEAVGESLAEDLLSRGARAILNEGGRA